MVAFHGCGDLIYGIMLAQLSFQETLIKFPRVFLCLGKLRVGINLKRDGSHYGCKQTYFFGHEGDRTEVVPKTERKKIPATSWTRQFCVSSIFCFRLRFTRAVVSCVPFVALGVVSITQWFRGI